MQVLANSDSRTTHAAPIAARSKTATHMYHFPPSPSAFFSVSKVVSIRVTYCARLYSSVLFGKVSVPSGPGCPIIRRCTQPEDPDAWMWPSPEMSLGLRFIGFRGYAHSQLLQCSNCFSAAASNLAFSLLNSQGRFSRRVLLKSDVLPEVDPLILN